MIATTNLKIVVMVLDVAMAALRFPLITTTIQILVSISRILVKFFLTVKILQKQMITPNPNLNPSPKPNNNNNNNNI